MRGPDRRRTGGSVTGAGRRLGRAIALYLARAGWRVAVHCHRSQAEAQATAAECGGAVFEADLADEAAARALVPRVAAHFGRVDAVVNSAALFEFDDAATFAPALLRAHMQVNAAAPVLLAQALAATGALSRFASGREARTDV